MKAKRVGREPEETIGEPRDGILPVNTAGDALNDDWMRASRMLNDLGEVRDGKQEEWDVLQDSPMFRFEPVPER
jgi:hypothetical protein